MGKAVEDQFNAALHHAFPQKVLQDGPRRQRRVEDQVHCQRQSKARQESAKALDGIVLGNPEVVDGQREAPLSATCDLRF